MDKPALPKLRPERRDYWHIGPVYVWKWLAVLLSIGASLAVLAAFGLPGSLTAPHEREPPAYRYTDKRLAGVSGVVRITDDAGTVRYEGEIAQGAITGRGRVYDAKGRLAYDGPLVDGSYEGKGAKVYSDGRLIYEGAMSANLYEGEGRRTDPSSGVVSEGTFSAGVFEGAGRQFRPDGTLTRSGTFSHELLNGAGMEYGADGTLLRMGTFQDGLLHGAGVQYVSGGALEYEGEFQFGLFHGQGKLYDTLSGALVCEGTFVRGEPLGPGRIYHPSGQLLYEGQVCEGQPRADAFLGLSLAEVETAFSEHWLLYSCGGVTAFVYPYFHLMFISETPIKLISPSQQDERTEQERRELLETIASGAAAQAAGEGSAAEKSGTAGGQPPDAASASEQAIVGARRMTLAPAAGPIGDRELSPDTQRSDVLITEVLSYGAPLAGTAQPDFGAASGARDAGWREWFSCLALGETLIGAAAVRTGPFVYEFSVFSGIKPARHDYYLATGNGVETSTVLRKWKDDPIWYQSAVRRDKET